MYVNVEPCVMCAAALMKVGVVAIFYRLNRPSLVIEFVSSPSIFHPGKPFLWQQVGGKDIWWRDGWTSSWEVVGVVGDREMG